MSPARSYLPMSSVPRLHIQAALLVAAGAAACTLPLVWWPAAASVAGGDLANGIWWGSSGLALAAWLTVGLSAFAAWVAIDIPRRSLRALVLLLTAVLLVTGLLVARLHDVTFGLAAPLAALVLAGVGGWAFALSEAGRRRETVRSLVQGRLSEVRMLEVVGEGAYKAEDLCPRMVVCEAVFGLPGGDASRVAAALEQATACVLSQGGFLERADGGGLRAIFGAFPGPQHAERAAVECAWLLATGAAAGVDCTAAVASGDGARLVVQDPAGHRHTIVGPAVLQATRAASAATVYGAGVVITADLRDEAEAGFTTRWLCVLATETGPVELFELVARRASKTGEDSAWLEAWNRGQQAFTNGDWAQAARAFREVTGLREDPVAAQFAARAELAMEASRD